MLLGYCCINETLRACKPSVFTNRTVIKKNFTREKASKLILQNVKDLRQILEWNEENNVKVFRISSEVFPQSTNGDLSYCPADLPDGEEIVATIKDCGVYAFQHGHILALHPGPFTCIGSDSDDVVTKSIQEVEAHNWFADTLCDNVPNLHVNINWHIGRNYGEGVSKRFLEGWRRLSEGVRKRSSIENDDKAKGWSVTKLYKELYEVEGIRLCLDLHHSVFSREEGVTLEQEFEMAKRTWNGAWQEVHHSNSEKEDRLIPAHSDFYRTPVPKWLEREEKVYVHLECKAKERALLDYRKKFG